MYDLFHTQGGRIQILDQSDIIVFKF